MRKFLLKTPLGVLCSAILILFVTIMFFYACRKIEYSLERDGNPRTDPTTRFFDISGDVTPIAKRIANSMKERNVQQEFVSNLSKLGFPKWDKCPTVIGTDPNTARGAGGGTADTLVLVPMVSDDTSKVTSFLACVARADSINIRLFNSYKYYDYDYSVTDNDVLTAETIASMTMFLETHALPKHDTFRVNDMNLFDYAASNASYKDSTRFVVVDNSPEDGNDARGQTMIMSWGEICYTISVQNYQGQLHAIAPGEQPAWVHEEEQCISAYFWVEVIDEYPSMVLPTIPNSGGAGGTGGTGFQQVNCSNFPSPACLMPPTHGWIRVSAEDPPNTYNPFIYDDSIGISTALETKYPCFTSLINDSLPNVNYIAQIAGKDVFNDQAYIHLTFDTSTVCTQSGQPSAQTFNDGSITVDANGFVHFSAVIKFNGWYLRNATNEYKIQTIIHESMHAIFLLRWAQYQVWLATHSGTIDSFFIKTHFPIYWSYIMQRGIPPTEIQQHEIMATDYYQVFSNLMKPLYNPNVPTSIRDTVIKALSYSGLYETSAWGLLPSKGVDTCKYRNINVTAQRSLIGTYNVSGCNSFTTHYQDSLKLTHGCN